MPEDWGGSTVFVDVSAKKRTNLNLLMEMICLVADLQDLKADSGASGERARCWKPSSIAAAVRVATVLVQNGTLRAGDNFVVGNVFGKVRAMFDDRGAPWKTRLRRRRWKSSDWKACRKRAINSSWWRTAKRRAVFPNIANRRRAKRSWPRVRESRWKGWRSRSRPPGMKELPIILKGDVRGSVEVLTDMLTQAFERKGEDQDAAHRRGRHHRNRRAAGFGVECGHHRLQRAAGAQGAGTGRAGEGRHPPALDHLRAAGRDQARHDWACWSRSSRKPTRAAPKCAIPSAFRRWAPLPVATCSMASSSAIPKFACCATTWRYSRARSVR